MTPPMNRRPPDSARYRLSMQDNYMRQIETDFAGMVRAVLRLFGTEAR
jgi:hypothetical protein